MWMVKRRPPNLQQTHQRNLSDRQDNDMEFDKAFKDGIEKEMASNNKNRKRKRNCIDTYNDLNEQELITDNGENSSDVEEDWVMENVFTV
jgi:hypothetical protein